VVLDDLVAVPVHITATAVRTMSSATSRCPRIKVERSQTCRCPTCPASARPRRTRR
jgi:hypothetical protein